MTAPRLDAESARPKRKPLPRSTKPIPRSPIARGGRPKPKKRKSSEFARIYHSKARVAWVKQQSCIACHRLADDGHHISVDGMGRKAGYDQIIPLCRSHHSAIHHHGSKTFAALVNVDLEQAAAETERRWLSHIREEAA